MSSPGEHHNTPARAVSSGLLGAVVPRSHAVIEIGGRVRQAVGGAQSVGDVFGPHAERRPQPAGGEGVEGRGGLFGLRSVHAHKVWAPGRADYGLFGHNHGS